MSQNVVVANNLSRRFGDLVAVDQLSFAVAKGEVFGLVGPDGAGKTTTLRMLCGLIDPDAGEAMVAGHRVLENVDAVKDAIGYMAQRFGLYGDLTVEENLDFYADLFGILGAEPPSSRGRRWASPGRPSRYAARSTPIQVARHRRRRESPRAQRGR